jgi:hypothetical protein
VKGMRRANQIPAAKWCATQTRTQWLQTWCLLFQMKKRTNDNGGNASWWCFFTAYMSANRPGKASSSDFGLTRPRAVSKRKEGA